MRRDVAMPSAPARSRFSRIAASDSPNGDWREPAREREQHEQHGEAVERGVALAGEADREEAEHRPDREVEPVGAAGQPAVAVGEFAEHQRHAHRHHQPREIGAAQQQRRGRRGRARRRRPRRRRGRASGSVIAGVREDRRGVGADAEKRRLSERDDAGEAEDEIERQREQARDRISLISAARDGKARIAASDGEPERDLAPAPALAPAEMASIRRVECGAHRPSPRRTGPAGAGSASTTMTA